METMVHVKLIYAGGAVAAFQLKQSDFQVLTRLWKKYKDDQIIPSHVLSFSIGSRGRRSAYVSLPDLVYMEVR